MLVIAVVSVAGVLGASYWLAARLSDAALRADLLDRVTTAVDRISGAPTDPDRLERILRAIVLDNRDVDALRLYHQEEGEWVVIAATRPGVPAPKVESAPIGGDDAHRDAKAAPKPITLADGEPGARLSRRVALEGETPAVVQADVSLRASRQLQARLRMVDFGLFVAAVVVLSLVLDLFFRRRVAPRLVELTRVMANGAAGRFDEPIPPLGAVELDSLATSLNAMLVRVRELTEGLEGQVASATTELEARSEELRELQAEAVRTERFAALGQMAATLAHELGTPLNSVLGYAQLLKQDETNAEQLTKLEIIESQVRRMIEIIRKALVHAREGAVERETVELPKLVDEVLTLVSTRADEQNIQLHTEFTTPEEIVTVDPIAVRQVMVNLINNAIDAEGTTAVHIQLSTTSSTRSGAQEDLAIEIQDDGVGIPLEQQEQIFKPFFTTKESGRGTGLGLAIVDHLVRSHGGQIDMDTTPGRGTTFRVRFPTGAGA